jgi:pimeloyl-ACP methyl ester carboxylesterase
VGDTAATLTLPDGRTLGYARWGPADGEPVFHCHGIPSCRLDGVPGDDAACEATGTHVVTVDRPGVGLSDRQPGRRLIDWPDDLAALADALGFERFAVLGWSAGSPFALACAARLPDRVTAVALVAPPAPVERTGDVDQYGRRRYFRIALAAPWLMSAAFRPLVPLARLSPRLATEVVWFGSSKPEMEIVRQAEHRAAMAATTPQMLRKGAGGIVEDMKLVTQPWGFDLDEVRTGVTIWHGDDDSFVPLESGERVAAALPDGQLVRCPGEGHFLIYERIEEILARLTAKG